MIFLMWTQILFLKFIKLILLEPFCNSKRNQLLVQNADRKSRIVNLSSRLGSIQLRGETQLGGALAYQCSKSALNMFTRQTALELESLKISIISISPGWVKTDMGGSNAKYEIHQLFLMMLLLFWIRYLL